jgi:hypothetical protein
MAPGAPQQPNQMRLRRNKSIAYCVLVTCAKILPVVHRIGLQINGAHVRTSTTDECPKTYTVQIQVVVKSVSPVLLHLCSFTGRYMLHRHLNPNPGTRTRLKMYTIHMKALLFKGLKHNINTTTQEGHGALQSPPSLLSWCRLGLGPTQGLFLFSHTTSYPIHFWHHSTYSTSIE